ncbi:MAG: hypothetical protein K2X64_04370 [Rhodocyclaceae bacterium]|nr:hypothetical protein [Rhodocyclaceae bacterium]
MSLLGMVFAIGGLVSPGKSQGTKGMNYWPNRRHQWHNPARIEAAAAKREQRQERNLRIAASGGIGMLL